MDHSSRQYCRKYNGPVFEPHLTLLGKPNLDSFSKKELIFRTRELASKLKLFIVFLGELSFSTTYFHSVFVTAKPTARLMEANLSAKKIFKADNNFFLPHMSLLYGNQSMTIREKLVSTTKFPKGLSFRADKIIAASDSGSEDPSKWKHVAEIPLLDK